MVNINNPHRLDMDFDPAVLGMPSCARPAHSMHIQGQTDRHRPILIIKIACFLDYLWEVTNILWWYAGDTNDVQRVKMLHLYWLTVSNTDGRCDSVSVGQQHSPPGHHHPGLSLRHRSGARGSWKPCTAYHHGRRIYCAAVKFNAVLWTVVSTLTCYVLVHTVVLWVLTLCRIRTELLFSSLYCGTVNFNTVLCAVVSALILEHVWLVSMMQVLTYHWLL